MNKLIYLGIITAVISISACRENDDDNTDDILNGSFHAVIDGTDWNAEPENVVCIVTNFGSNGPVITVTGSRAADTTHFSLYFPYFSGADTVINDPTAGSNVWRFQDSGTVGGLWDAGTGTLNVARTIQDGYETYTGTFNGNFVDFFDSTNVRVVTGGIFTAKRLL